MNPSSSPRPAHLNLDVRHAFRTVDLSLTVDGKRTFHTTLTGSGKRFGVFGKRAERGFTKTLDLPLECESSVFACDPRPTSLIRHGWNGSISIQHR